MVLKKEQYQQEKDQHQQEMRNIMFTREQLLNSKTFQDKRDILSVILEDEQEYSLADVHQLIREFLERKV